MFGGIWNIRIRNVMPCLIVPTIFAIVVMARWALLAHASCIKGLVPGKLEDVITANMKAMESFKMRPSETTHLGRKPDAVAHGHNGHPAGSGYNSVDHPTSVPIELPTERALPAPRRSSPGKQEGWF